jgi:hypothetical protein
MPREHSISDVDWTFLIDFSHLQLLVGVADQQLAHIHASNLVTAGE